MTFTEPDLYRLFLIVDSLCRTEDWQQDGELITLREKLLPVYRARHAEIDIEKGTKKP